MENEINNKTKRGRDYLQNKSRFILGRYAIVFLVIQSRQVRRRTQKIRHPFSH